MSNPDILTPRGELEIWKVFDDDRPDECVFDDHNIITSGLGISLAYLYAGQGASSVLNYQINQFQIGSGTQAVDAGLQELDGPLLEAQYKSAGSLLATEDRLFMKNPRGVPPDASVLVAYRQFDLPKASDFAIVFKWSIIF